MTKYVVLIGLALVVWWLWRMSFRRRKTTARPPRERPVEGMVRCARCGVNQPMSESILADGRYYCCSAHWHEATQQGD